MTFAQAKLPGKLGNIFEGGGNDLSNFLLIAVLLILFFLFVVGVICAAPAVEGAWWRAQVITFYKETSEVEIRYVDYGGYDRVKINTLRQIR